MLTAANGNQFLMRETNEFSTSSAAYSGPRDTNLTIWDDDVGGLSADLMVSASSHRLQQLQPHQPAGAGGLGLPTPTSVRVQKHLRWTMRLWPVVILLLVCYCLVYLYQARQGRLDCPLDQICDGNAGLPYVHILVHQCVFPQLIGNIIAYWAAHKFLAQTPPDNWEFKGQKWNTTRADKVVFAVNVSAVIFSVGYGLNPFFHWPSVWDYLMYLLIVPNFCIQFLMTGHLLTIFNRVIYLVEHAIDELDASVDDTDDAVEVVKQCRARVFVRTNLLLEHAGPFLNVFLADALMWLVFATLAVFQSPHELGGYLGFLWFMFALGFQLWQLSKVNSRHTVFTRRFHTLTKPNTHDLLEAMLFFKEHELQVMLLGVPITRSLFARTMASAFVPLIVASAPSIKAFVLKGYF
jgi:hypothetical protein